MNEAVLWRRRQPASSETAGIRPATMARHPARQQDRMTTFPSPENAETAFYEAFQAGDAQAMRHIWLDSPHCVCIHPGGERLQGTDLILESWDDLLPGMRGVVVHRSEITQGGGGGGERRGVMLATNGYRHDGQGWRMVLHHASADPQPTPEWDTGRVH